MEKKEEGERNVIFSTAPWRSEHRWRRPLATCICMHDHIQDTELAREVRRTRAIMSSIAYRLNLRLRCICAIGRCDREVPVRSVPTSRHSVLRDTRGPCTFAEPSPYSHTVTTCCSRRASRCGCHSVGVTTKRRTLGWVLQKRAGRWVLWKEENLIFALKSV